MSRPNPAILFAWTSRPAFGCRDDLPTEARVVITQTGQVKQNGILADHSLSASALAKIKYLLTCDRQALADWSCPLWCALIRDGSMDWLRFEDQFIQGFNIIHFYHPDELLLSDSSSFPLTETEIQNILLPGCLLQTILNILIQDGFSIDPYF